MKRTSTSAVCENDEEDVPPVKATVQPGTSSNGVLHGVVGELGGPQLLNRRYTSQPTEAAIPATALTIRRRRPF